MKARRFLPFLSFLVLPLLHAAELSSSDGLRSDGLGSAASLSGNMAFIGAVGSLSSSGSAYIFRNLGPTTGAVTEQLKLTASDSAAGNLFGDSVSLSGNMGLVGARSNKPGTINGQGAAYLFRNLDTAPGGSPITQNVKLVASNPSTSALFGSAVSLSGNIGLVGAKQGDSYNGAAYIFRGLDTATGTITESARLTTSDIHDSSMFGHAVALSGTTAVVGAHGFDVSGFYTSEGRAYVFRNVDTRTGTTQESIKLTSSTYAVGDFFGKSVAISGAIAIVGADGHNVGANNTGAAFVYRGLDTRSGTIVEDVKLVASDRQASDSLGESVSISGGTALAGASKARVGSNTGQGAAYLYTGLATATGTISERVKITASAGSENDAFGSSVTVEGDLFVIGAVTGDARYTNTGKAYAGTISSMTTLDVGGATRLISGLSFTSQDHWIVGQTSSSNTVTLAVGNTATVMAANKIVAIGQTAGSNANTLDVAGVVNANTVTIGATGNFGNLLRLTSTADLNSALIVISGGNSIAIQGNLTGAGALLGYLGDTVLQVNRGGAPVTITNGNQSTHLTSAFANGYTTFTVIPETSASLLFMAGAVASMARRRR